LEQVKEKIMEVLSAVLPITLAVILLQFTIIWLPMDVFIQFLIGAVLVTTGLVLFLIGVEVGLLPVGEMIGSTLPKTKKLWMLVLFGFIFGFVVTVAEPDVRVLALQVDQVSAGAVPKNILIYSVALGVGSFRGSGDAADHLQHLHDPAVVRQLRLGFPAVLFYTE